ncbi:DUF2917 domain-containing protein [Chitinolyticbacter meiyuanensis]|uniref:DUF2917 domain-containing protein n=1 Tax=Chitinolyticbacter meiyuanensis TaxID=682798 RepID=UPI0011E5F6E5|nr:DUF2917 domain-containing protein [Chitinolyticbacter meiyuanensis]
MKHISMQCAGLVAAFECRAGTELSCQHGLLWVTEGGGDLLLRSGERLRLTGAQRVVIQALQPSRFRLTSPASAWLAATITVLQALYRRLRRVGGRKYDVRLTGQQT